MFCTNCGEKYKEADKFCKNCGAKITKSGHLTVKKAGNAFPIDQKTTPYPYLISASKLIIMSVVTFGLYDIYWFYRHFKSFKSENNWDIQPFARAFFYPLFSYTLFREINKTVKSMDASLGVSTVVTPIFLFFMNALWRLPDPYWLVMFLSVLFLVPAQNTLNEYWKAKYGDRVIYSKFGGWEIILTLVGGFLLILAMIGLFVPDEDYFSNDHLFDNLDNSSENINAVKEGFMEGCDADGSTTAYCECAFDYLSARYSVAEIVKMGNDYESVGTIPSAMNDASEYCVDSL